MFKFQLRNFLNYDFSLVERDDKGKVTFEKRVEFFGGQTTPDFVGGSLHTDNEKVANLLRKHPWFDKEFFEVELPGTKKANTKTASEKTPEPAPKAEPVVAEEVHEDVPEPVKEASNEALEEVPTPKVTVFADITTVQQAAAKIRELDPKVKTTEVRTIGQINKVAARLNVSFPNL